MRNSEPSQVVLLYDSFISFISEKKDTTKDGFQPKKLCNIFLCHLYINDIEKYRQIVI